MVLFIYIIKTNMLSRFNNKLNATTVVVRSFLCSTGYRVQSISSSTVKNHQLVARKDATTWNKNRIVTTPYFKSTSRSYLRYFSDKTPSNNDDVSNEPKLNMDGSADDGKNTTTETVQKAKTITPEKLDAIINEEVPLMFDEGGVEHMIAIPEDPFGLHFQDGSNQLGPILPPIYERDAITGRIITNDTSDATSTSYKQQVELSDEDKYLLSLDTIERDMKLYSNLQQHYNESKEKDDSPATVTGDEHSAVSTAPPSPTSLPKELIAIGERIRTTHIGTNILGRSAMGQKAVEVLEDGTERHTRYDYDQGISSQPLTIDEYRTLEQYIKQKYTSKSVGDHTGNDTIDGIPASTLENVTMDDIPVSVNQRPTFVPKPKKEVSKYAYLKNEEEEIEEFNTDDTELSLKWLTSRAQRQMDDSNNDNPYSDLLPNDLSPHRVVNRKKAKIIPPKLLHFNNVHLLQNFIVPETGQIRNRIQSRLGARDQRRVKRCIKRARHLGLLPYNTQFKVETHGWINDPTIHTTKSWEQALINRGLVIQKPKEQQHKAVTAYSTPAQKQLTMTETSTTGNTTASSDKMTTAPSPLPDGM